MIAAQRGTAPTNGEIARRLFNGLAGILGFAVVFFYGTSRGFRHGSGTFRHCEEKGEQAQCLASGYFLKLEAGPAKIFRFGSGISAKTRISCGSRLMTGFLR